METCEGSGIIWTIEGDRKRGHDLIVHNEVQCPLCVALTLAEEQSVRADEEGERASEAEKRADAAEAEAV